MKILIVIFGLCLDNCYAYIMEPGPQVEATVGEVWPKPKYSQRSDYYFKIDPNNFEFEVLGKTCLILENAILRYKEIIKLSVNSIIRNKTELFIHKEQNVTKISVNLSTACERLPHFEMDERYYVTGSGGIKAHSIWGILRGLETYSQLITPSSNGMLKIPDIIIYDYPRFPHRGLLLDTARHYIKTDTIFTILDGMAYNKLNVFHWHIVDDESFPYQSVKFPELSEKGAYMPSMIYTQENISNIIEYARMRGIRVVAEFDVPGHTRSWGNAHPEILTECGGKFGPLNPINNKTYDFLQSFFSEVRDVFPDKFIHVGGNEVDLECWENNEEIQSYIQTKNIKYLSLQKMFMERITNILTNNKSFAPIVWQDAIVKNVEMPNEVIVQVWINWQYYINQFTKSGYRVLMSGCWILEHILTGADWVKYYNCEPYVFGGTPNQNKLIIGGEACMWSENVNNYNVIQTIFPRVSAVAEKLWSEKNLLNINEVGQRLEEHTCRMILRGIPVRPANGPGIC